MAGALAGAVLTAEHFGGAAMTGKGQTLPSGAMPGSSAKPPKADIWGPAGNVAEVPIVGIVLVL